MHREIGRKARRIKVTDIVAVWVLNYGFDCPKCKKECLCEPDVDKKENKYQCPKCKAELLIIKPEQ